MRYALIGYGRMGRAIERVAADRGHEATAIIDPTVSDPRVRHELDTSRLDGAEVAFEFTAPGAAAANVRALLEAGLCVVCGTTGWQAGEPGLDSAAAAGKAAAVVAPNFSVGMNLFYRTVRETARIAGGSGLYDPYVFELHHRGKLDAPSGTAARLAALVRDAAPDWSSVQFGCPAEGAVDERAVHVASVRAGHEPGTHTVGFDGEHDRIELTHRARGRGGFALGAVLAAEWVRGRTGVHGFDRVLEDLVKGGRS